EDSIREASGLAPADFEAAIRESVAHQLLVPDGTQGYAFRHALIREAIYGDLLPGERTRLHARFAELLADPDRLASVPGTAAELALHCLASHDITGAFTASVEAAQAAVDALPENSPTREWARARALATLAQTLMYARDEEAAAAVAERAKEVARAADVPWVEADALVTLGQLSEGSGLVDEAI